LWAAGAPAAGYNGAAAALTSDPSSRLFTASAIIDLTSGAEYPLAGGIYVGEFLVTTSTGEVISAGGKVIISGLYPPPGEYEIDGG
jgi:hypothetical protein